jgi:hypothetical protein
MAHGSIAGAVAVLLALTTSAGAVSNAVTQWQDTTAQLTRDFNLSTQISARYYALTNIAQYQVSAAGWGLKVLLPHCYHGLQQTMFVVCRPSWQMKQAAAGWTTLLSQVGSPFLSTQSAAGWQGY